MCCLLNLSLMQRCEVLQRKDATTHLTLSCLWVPVCVYVCVGWGGSNITVNYHYHRDPTLDCTQHNRHIWTGIFNCPTFKCVFSPRQWKQGELRVHISTVRGMQIETVANGISTISSLVSKGVAKH